jgi:4-amino-4-deoxychorismate lyase
MSSNWDSIEQAWDNLKKSEHTHWQNYLGFYSSWLNGYFQEPWAMQVPMDDHGFHRGDGVFEAVRIHNRAYIDLHAHLKRLRNSAAAIGMKLPKETAEIADICVELGRRTGAESGVLRLFVTRGPGGFSPSPNEVVGHQLYAVVTRMRPPSAKVYEDGCRAMLSTIPAKDPFWSQIKSNNYLQNVLMKRECLEKGFDFSISVGQDGILCEGATENILLFSSDRDVIVPNFDYTLRGTTVSEVMRIAEELKTKVRSVRFGDVTAKDLFSAQEAAFVGTTLGVLPIGSVDERKIGSGKAGPLCTQLNNLWMEKMAEDRQLRTPF